MIRRNFIALTLTFGLSLAAAGSAIGQSSNAKAIVDAAKASGTVGESGDGFLGLVRGSADPSVQAAVAEINFGRAQAYKTIAAKSGVTVEAAGEATAQQLLTRLAPGGYYRPIGGAWTRK